MPKDLLKELSEMPETGADIGRAIRTIFPKLSPEMEERLRHTRQPWSQFTKAEMEDYPEGVIVPQRPLLDPYSTILPMGTIKGVKQALDLAEAGARTVKGKSVLDKVLRWFKPKYEGKLWEPPGRGFARGGAFGRYHRLKGQAPGTGVKVARDWRPTALEGEIDFLRSFHDNPEVGRRVYNADQILMEYMPKFHTMPAEGGRFLYTKAMEPLEWGTIKDLPIHKQRQLFINFAYHAKRLGKRLDKYDLWLGDMHFNNWGITREGKPVIMDLGIVSRGTPGDGTRSSTNLIKRASWQFSNNAHPGEGRFDLAAGLANKIKKGQLSEKELSSPNFWNEQAVKAGLSPTSTAPVGGPPLSSSGINDPDDVIRAMSQETTPDFGSLDKWLKGASPGTRTREDSISALEARIRLHESMDRSRQGGSYPDLWKSDIARLKKELAKRKKSITVPAKPGTKTRYSLKTPEKPSLGTTDKFRDNLTRLTDEQVGSMLEHNMRLLKPTPKRSSVRERLEIRLGAILQEIIRRGGRTPTRSYTTLGDIPGGISSPAGGPPGMDKFDVIDEEIEALRRILEGK